jgi:two-component system chemotaxis response regulator CheY
LSSRILIVDDSKFLRMLLADLLTRNGFEVLEAESGEQAVKVFLEESPDLVTLDILMPGRDGIETLQDLRAQSPEARVVMVTALGMEDYIKRALDSGADGFILKPFSAEKVLETVQEVLERPVPGGAEG